MKKKYTERKATIVIIGLIILMIFLLVYTVFMSIKIMLPFYYAYIIFLINAMFFAFAITDSFNQEHNDLINLKNTLEAKVTKRTKQLEEANQQKINFFINIAHETKTPLTLISNYLEKYINKTEKSEELTIIKKNIDKLKKDMINVLDIKKIEKGQLFYNHNTIINLSSFLEAKIVLFKEIARKRGITITLKIIGKHLLIKIDPYALDRLINNLIDNAIKYNRENGKIKISLTDKSNKIILSVSDTGIGISQKHQNYIFDIYHQISHKKQNIQGIGVGLYIVKKILDELNADIKIKSTINEGTEFIISLKKHILKQNETVINNINFTYLDSELNIELKKENFNPEKNNIFIIEDNLEMLKYLQDSFYEEYNVFYSLNGKIALDKIDEIPRPNIIISDVMMDIMDGLEFYEKLNENQNFNDIPFIFLTAKTSIVKKMEGLRKGAVDYIYKPFSIYELKSKVKSLIKIQHSQKSRNLTSVYDEVLNALEDEYNSESQNSHINKIFINNKINDKEKNIIYLLIDGLEYKKISIKLKMSIHMVKKRVQNIYKKLNVKNKVELINKFKI